MLKGLRFSVIAFFSIAWLFMHHGSLFAQDREEKLNKCISAMSRLQSYIEFYYMETGIYPLSIESLEKVINEDVEQGKQKVQFPKDPATGREFVYTPGGDYLSYTLNCPDPSAYGVKKLGISEVNWGWMNMIALERRKNAMAHFCKYNMEIIALAIKRYKDGEKKLPENLKAMVPGCLKVLPLCPVSNKEYIFSKRGDEYILSCPNPGNHDLTIFQFSSKDGFNATPIDVPPPEDSPKSNKNAEGKGEAEKNKHPGDAIFK